MNTGRYYFISDIHLGMDGAESSHHREKRLVNWLENASKDATAIYILGDLFDFWFEYRKAVPRGYVRILGKLAELSDKAIPIHLFTGNHDMWIFDYIPQETGVRLHRQPFTIECNGKKLFLGHGDGLGPGDYRYKFIKKVFASPLSQWLFARLHPNLGIGMADFWSKKSRNAHNHKEDHFMGEANEWLYRFCEDSLKKEAIDYFIFGHRHLPLDRLLSNGKSRYINLGDWLYHYSWAVLEPDGTLRLEKLSDIQNP